ncbi:MAG: GNAT family N-acetyltransferase [Clostridia bacterium]|nr:GNAT family N-acetyltransferase [Clostridia bacterium]
MKFEAKLFHELTVDELYQIWRARAQVFTMEQRVYYLDADNIDQKCLHCFLWKDGAVIAYLRAFYDDKERTTVKIGRVLTTTHGLGHGRLLMEKSMLAIRECLPHKCLALHSQSYVVGFYEKLGFAVTSEEFTEAGIPHREMEWRGE